MIQYLKYRVELARLFRQKESIRNAYADDIRQARADGKSSDDIQSLEHSSFLEDKMVDEEISILATESLIRHARRRFVPIPSHETVGMWERCETISNRHVLTGLGISELHSSLRREQKEHIEHVMMVLATLTGIVGAVTGLVAVILK